MLRKISLSPPSPENIRVDDGCPLSQDKFGTLRTKAKEQIHQASVHISLLSIDNKPDT
jgi:hypothetical protein